MNKIKLFVLLVIVAQVSCDTSDQKKADLIRQTEQQAREKAERDLEATAQKQIVADEVQKELALREEAMKDARKRAEAMRGTASRKTSAKKVKRSSRGGRKMAIRPAPVRPKQQMFNTEGYDHTTENQFKLVRAEPLSTFSVDVDTASYSNVRRFINKGQLPPKGAVRIEEMVNYFSYNYPPPTGEDAPFFTSVEMASCPWMPKHQLVRIGLKGKKVPPQDRPPANLVFLLDVSGSMGAPNKLPLLQASLKLAVNQLSEKDRVAIVVYAGASGLVLPSTAFDDRQKILEALRNLKAGGATNAGDGIQLAYSVATHNFIKGGINRVILATDGDFNVGMSSQSDLIDLVQKRSKSGVFLTVLGFGMGNYKDDMLEKLADKGNGNYAYIDTFQEARKVFSEQIGGTLMTIAKDVKIQVEFNPEHVDAYRLIGYENRILQAQDFNDDKKDAGEIGAGHTVTALYQVVPTGVPIGAGTPQIDALKYQKTAPASALTGSDEIMTVKVRYKRPAETKSKKLEFPLKKMGGRFADASDDFRFAVAVAGFGMLLTGSQFKGDLTYDIVAAVAESAKGKDKHGYRAEFKKLVKTAKVCQVSTPSKPSLKKIASDDPLAGIEL